MKTQTLRNKINQKNRIMESGKITTKLIKGIYTALYSIGIIALFIGYNFKDSPPPSGWYLQTMPNLNGRSISDITFVDSLTGYATAYLGTDTNYFLKTTNGGDNWLIVYRDYSLLKRVQFLNENTGYICGSYLKKTTNGGINWTSINTSGISAENMWVHNEDTIWLILSESLTGGVFRTTNGGQSWTQQLSAGSQNPDKIYMYNARIGFICNLSSNKYFRKTTDGGNSWFTILQNEAFSDIYFLDSLTGWRAFGTMKKTTNGGLNWVSQQLPQGGNIVLSQILRFSNINKDTIWGGDGFVIYPNSQLRGILYRTTNGGDNWYYQVPDTSFHNGRYSFIKFVNKQNGWAQTVFNGVHTITGGDTTFYTGIIKINEETVEGYSLEQNYPNPFNSRTVIKYSVKKESEVKITIYDIIGRIVSPLVDMRQQSGNYQVDYPGKLLSSGIYFYDLVIDGKRLLTRKMVMAK